MSEEEMKWKEEAIELAPEFYLYSIEQIAFIKGYLQACKVREEEIDRRVIEAVDKLHEAEKEIDQKEVEREQFSKELIEERMRVVELEEEIKRLRIAHTVYEE